MDLSIAIWLYVNLPEGTYFKKYDLISIDNILPGGYVLIFSKNLRAKLAKSGSQQHVVGVDLGC